MKKILLLFLPLLLVVACFEKEEEKKEPAAKSEAQTTTVGLSPADFSDLTGWQNDKMEDFAPVLRDVCGKIMNMDSDFIGNGAVKISTADYQRVCRDFLRQKINDGDELRRFMERNFTPALVWENGNAEGKFTAYYEAQINASRQKHGSYVVPVYGRPDDLIEIRLKDFDASLPDKKLAGRVSGNNLVPYYTRAEIEQQSPAAPVLLWADSDVDVHIMQIQGSAVALLDDGSRLRIGYDGNNGRAFTGIGSILLAEGVLAPGRADMISIKNWLKNNPEEGKRLMLKNERYIFHRLIDGNGPIGAFGLPLAPGRSLAVDRQYIPLGALLWLETTAPNGQPLQKIVAAEDIGSAIKGAVRGDYFWGSGGDDVLAEAGKMNASGHYYIFIPKGANNEQRQ